MVLPGGGSFKQSGSLNRVRASRAPNLWSEMPENDVRDLIIIGGGPAGYTAALYAARANLSPLVIEGVTFGGQLMITSDVENYPGYPDGILGPQMMQDFRRQAERFGAEYVTDDVTAVDFSERPFRVEVGDDAYYARAVIVATGASARQLGLESERTLQGRGVHLGLAPLPATQPVTVQLKNSDGACWDAVYSAPAQKNDGTQLRDKSD